VPVWIVTTMGASGIQFTLRMLQDVRLRRMHPGNANDSR
jgi:hypothetical protein